MKKVFQSTFYAVIIAVFCNILWGSAFPTIKTLYQETGIKSGQIYMPIFLAGVRFFLASLIVLLMYKIATKEKIIFPKSKNLIVIFSIGILQTFFQYIFFFLGLVNIDGSKASIMIASEVFFTFALAHVIFHNDKITVRKFLGLLIGFVGVVLVNLDGKGLNFDFKITGEGFILLSAFSNACALIIIKKYSKGINPIFMTGWQMLFGSTILLIIGIFGFKTESLYVTPKGIIVLIYSVLLSATAFALWNTLIKYHNLTKMSIYKFTTPIFGAILSVIFLSEEKLNKNIIIALIFVVVGIIFIYYRSDNSKKCTKGDTHDYSKL